MMVWYEYNFKDGTTIWTAAKYSRAELAQAIREHGPMIGTYRKVVDK